MNNIINNLIMFWNNTVTSQKLVVVLTLVAFIWTSILLIKNIKQLIFLIKECREERKEMEEIKVAIDITNYNDESDPCETTSYYIL